MNVKDSIKKVGAVAASTLMVGMTMGAAQSLSEFPGMFVDDEGSPTAQVVVGSQGAVSDVVGAVNVAAALGQATIQTEEMTEEVDVETSGGSIGWDAGEGQVLDTQNDNLYFDDNVNQVRQTLTEDHLDALDTVEFTDDAGNSQDVDHYLYLNDRNIGFGNPGDTGDQDPFLYVENPANVGGVDQGLYRLQANFGDGLEIAQSDGGNEDVLGEEIDLFGKTFTISEDSFDSNHEGQLVLFGSSEEYDLETGESTEFEIDGETHSLEVRAVTSSDTAAFFVDGELRERDEGETFNVDGTDIRVDSVIQTSSQDSEGLVTFSIGSEEYILEDGEPVESGDEEVDGTYVSMSGASSSDNVDDNDIDISSVEIGVGAEDSDFNYVAADDTFEDPLFEGLQFHFGGLAPDAAEGGDSVGEIDFTTDDEAVEVGFADGDDSATVSWFYDGALEDSDEEPIHVVEGEGVQEDEYFLTDAGDFDHMWQVTGIDADEDTDSDIEDSDEATVDLEDQVTGADVEVNLDGDAGDDRYEGEEVIDGQTYHFWTSGASTDTVHATWGGADFGSNGDHTTVFPALDTDSDASVAFTDKVDVEDAYTASDSEDTSVETYELPSTESTDAQTVDVEYYHDTADDTVYADIGNDQDGSNGDASVDSTGTSTDQAEFTVGQTDYVLELEGDGNAGDVNVDIGVSDTQDGDSTTELGPATVVLQPEDDGDEEHGYVVAPTMDGEDADVADGSHVLYTGGSYSPTTLEESDEDMDVSYNRYGTYTMQDTEDEGSFSLHVPNQQAVAGAAFTGSGGELSMGGGTGTGTGEVTYTGVTNEDIRGALPDMAKTDDQVTSSDRQNSHLILVGGPAVNTLVADLADDGDTWTAEQWRNEHVDEALLQVVEDAFADGQHAMIVAGHSADDTRAAARYISEWRSHQDTLEEAGMQYSPSSQEAPR